MRREVDQQREIIGKVISHRKMKDQDLVVPTFGSPKWVVDVDIGKNRPLRDVPIKAGGEGSHFYADLGQTVRLHRNAQGRYDIIGPGDRVTATTQITEYDLTSGDETAASTLGFTFQIVPFEYYANLPSGDGNSRWNDTVTPFPLVRVVDSLGNPVT